MAYQAIPEGAGSDSDVSIEALSKQAAASALGVSASSLVGYVIPIYAQGETGHFSAGAGTGSRAKSPQGLILTTGATVNSNYHILASSNAATAPRLIPSGAAKQWWVGAVFAKQTATAIASGDGFGIVLADDTLGFIGFVGGHGASQTGNFAAAMYNGSFSAINSGVAFDTQSRLHEFWRDGTTGNYRLNLASTFYAGGGLGAASQADIRPSQDVTYGVTALSGASGTNYSVKMNWVAGWAVRE